ncbi:hypothetical protein FOZ61_011135 [Perkinsus olseni]|uniref:Uncharacterized protein n=1 Tax=Perkinsus olseni TaxID=32597 RepID=A0A7J6KW00_PEROL|nr:hypothetical protein FOZ61_011135 [Perkinsus olseni]
MYTILTWLATLVLFPLVNARLVGKFAAIGDLTFHLVFVVNEDARRSDDITVDVIFGCRSCRPCDTYMLGAAGPFAAMAKPPGSNDYIIDYNGGAGNSTLSVYAQVEEACYGVMAKDDLSVFEYNPDDTITTTVAGRTMVIKRVDTEYATLYRYRSSDIQMDWIVTTYRRALEPIWSNLAESTLPVVFYASLDPITRCGRARLTMYDDDMDMDRDETYFPSVIYRIGDGGGYRSDEWEEYKHDISRVCGKNLEPNNLTYVMHTTQNTAMTEVEAATVSMFIINY